MSDENTVNPTLQMRHNRKSYMDVKEPSAVGFKLMGEGFTNLSDSLGAKEYSRKYIHMQSEISDVIGYAPSKSYSLDVLSGDPVVDDIKYITDNELVGVDTHRDIVTYDEYDVHTTSGQNPVTYYDAYKRTYAVIPDGAADGTEALIITGSFKAVSDKTNGYFIPSTQAFSTTVPGSAG